ncbi:MAG TPA: hypothetical protein VGC40_06205 [Paenirhodobacter sp.]
MRPALIPTLILALLPASFAVAQSAPAQLGPPMTADQFDERTRGKTIEYSAQGQPYGTEEYRPGHKVVWAFEGDECREGDWFPRGEQICFDYHDETELQCWTFHDTPGGLVALFEGQDQGQPLMSLRERATPLNCPAPDLGV